jgi:signal transduction histidine kinase
MIPNTRFGFCGVEDYVVQQLAKVFGVNQNLSLPLPDAAATLRFMSEGGFGYPAGKILLIGGDFLDANVDCYKSIKEALTDPTFHSVLLNNGSDQLKNLRLQEHPNLHVIDLSAPDAVSDLTHHLHEIKSSIEFIWLNAKVSDILGNYERIYVDQIDHSKRIQKFIDCLIGILKARSVHVYLLDGSTKSFQSRYHSGEALCASIRKQNLEDYFEFSDTCYTYRVPSAFKEKAGLLKSKALDPLIVLSTFKLFTVPGFIAFVFDPLYDEALMRELCAVGAREIFHLLRAKLIRSQYDCLKSLTEITNIDESKREVLWKVLERLKDHFQVNGFSIVELVVSEDGTKFFEKTYIHYGLKDFDKFPEKESFVQYCVSTGKALIINETNIPDKYGVGFAFDPDCITPETAERVRLNTLVAPKGDENEVSLMFFPLKQGDRILGAIKVGDFSRPYAFDLHQLRALSVFADPILVLLENIQQIQKLKAQIESNLERDQFAEDAEALFFYREIALGVFHQVSNHLTNLYSTLQTTEMKAEARETKPFELREPLGKAIKLAKTSKELIATAHNRGKTLKPIQQQCYLVKDVLRPAFEYTQRKVEDIGTKFHLEHVFTSKDYLVYLDKELTKESFINVLNNAVWAVKANKSTTKHEIFIGLRELSDEKAVRIEITDSGVGIRKEDFGKLFTPFFTTRQPDGTGLGLYFARSIFQELGGTITIPRSNPGKGTTVEIVIPFEEVVKV